MPAPSSVRHTGAALLALGVYASCNRFRHDTADAGADAAIADAAVVVEAAPAALEYRSEASGFRIEFPEGKAPEVEDKALPKGAASVRLFKVQYGSSAFLVVAEEIAESAGRTPDQLLQGAREGLLESTGATADHETAVTSGAYRGFEMVLAATTSGIKMRQRVRVLVAGRRLYQLLVVAPEWSGSTPLEQRFFDSFRLAEDGGL
jgi:hypothetical protein